MNPVKGTDAYTQKLAITRHYRKLHGKRYDENKKFARYNFSREQYQIMLDKQDDVCAICRGAQVGGKRNLSIDHDRACCNRLGSCGRCVRGLLCISCNARLGTVETFTNQAATYLNNTPMQQLLLDEDDDETQGAAQG